jgi:hypothetical protein
MSTVNLANITDVVFNTTSVNELIVDGTLTWIKYNNQSYSIGQEFWISGVVHTITGFDHSSGVPLSFQFNDASGTSNYITITNPTFSSSDPSVNNTPYSIDQVVYINGVTEKTITGISGTTITFSDDSTLDYGNLGGVTISTTVGNGTPYSVNQVVYINGVTEKTITDISGTTITFSDNSTLDNDNLGSDTIEENPTNGTNFSVNQVVYINGLIEKTITGIVGTTITFSDGSTLDNSNLSSGSSIDEDPLNNTNYEVGNVLTINGNEERTILKIVGTVITWTTGITTDISSTNLNITYNTTDFTIGQTVYINGLVKKNITAIHGAVITFSSNLTTPIEQGVISLDADNFGSYSVDLVAINNTIFSIGETLWLDGVEQKTIADIINRVIYWTDGTQLDSSTTTIALTYNQPPPPNTSGYEEGEIVLYNGENKTVSSVNGDVVSLNLGSQGIVAFDTSLSTVDLGPVYKASNIPWKVGDRVYMWNGMSTILSGLAYVDEIIGSVIHISVGTGSYKQIHNPNIWVETARYEYDWATQSSSDGIYYLAKYDIRNIFDPSGSGNGQDTTFKVAQGTGFIEVTKTRTFLRYGYQASYGTFHRRLRVANYPFSQEVAIGRQCNYPGSSSTKLFTDSIDLTDTGVVIKLKTLDVNSSTYTATCANGNWSYNPTTFD